MYYDKKILIGKSGDEDIYIYPKMANRHGLIAGATGTGKTITLKVLAESFSDAGVPVFLADVKGDLAAMCCVGEETDSLRSRIDKLGLDEKGFNYSAYPANYWDVYQQKGMPLRTTISEMGPLLLSRILGLNDTQTDLLTVVFKIADDQGLLLIDTKDLKAMLNYVVENAEALASDYGNIAKASINVIIRAIVALESEGGEIFFGEPALNIADWFTTGAGGKGMIQILDCQTLINHPTMYATFLLWMISELFEALPEAGDLEKPKMVFFFDEAHMLFNGASKVLLEKIEQMVKLIRSKGVGIFFITQTPRDIPDGVLAQLGNKVQHALHAYTPAEMKAVKAAAQSFRVNPEFDTQEAIQALGIGEALISVLDETGTPTIVKKAKILPPQSQMGALDDHIREEEMQISMLYRRYTDFYDRDSAYEFLKRQNDAADLRAREEAEALAAQKEYEREQAAAEKEAEKARLAAEKEAERARAAAEKEAAREQAAAEKEAERARAAAEREAARAQAAAEKEAARKQALAEREAERARAAAEKEAERARIAAEKEEAKKKAKVTKAVKNVASTTAGTIGREVGKSFGSTMGGSFGKTLGGNVGASLGRSIMGTLFK